MWNELSARARGVVDQLRDVPTRLRVAAEFSRSTGMLWSMTQPGLAELVKVMASGSQNPSKIYRVHAANSPNKPALIWRGRTSTFAELDRRIDRFAAGLAQRGFGRNQSVILMMKNRPEHLELGAAATRLGAASVAISWRSTASELVYLANHSGARGIALDEELLPVLEEARPHLSSDFLANVFVAGDTLDALLESDPRAAKEEAAGEDAAIVIYTSGTTGKPKGAVRKFPKDTMPAAMRFINETPMRIDDVHLVTCPLYHSTAFGFMTFAHVLGNTVVLMDEFKPEAFLSLVEQHEVTSTAMVPTMLHRILELPAETRARYDARSLRAVFTTGAALPGPLANDFMDAYGDVVFNLYGSTETGMVTLAKPEDLRAAPGTIGKAVPGNDIRLLDDDKRDVAPGEVGELYVKNQVLVAGYHKDAKATSDSMVDGYFSVGDLARRDRDGRFFIEGRKRDMVISGGVNVYPAEVEGVLEQHPAVGEVAVVGVPDREWGERVRAFVVPKLGMTLDEPTLKTFARERLSGPKVPRDFVFLDALPRNPTGKVLKRELRDHAVG
ncbi:MAG: AMP-binding protein [Labilithrix sp.]|nr:AMP-binding protein [Labilithrix sp.]MCW5818039.1 AMP-binding protein [Labilithrix sp.]